MCQHDVAWLGASGEVRTLLGREVLLDRHRRGKRALTDEQIAAARPIGERIVGATPLGVEMVAGTPAEMDAVIQRDGARWSGVIRDAAVKVD